MIKYKLLILILFSNIILKANDTIKFLDRTRLKISVFNEGVFMPMYPHFTSVPVHPGLLSGIEYYHKKKLNSQFFQTLNIGFFIHKKYEHGIFLNSEVGDRYILPFGLAFEGLFGLGYLHTITDGPEFEQNNDGIYEQTKNYGRSHVLGSLAVGIGYDFSKKTNLDIHPHISYQFMVEYPWSSGEDGLSPVLPRSNLYIGLIFNIPQFLKTRNN
jgi:hypothetical protein